MTVYSVYFGIYQGRTYGNLSITVQITSPPPFHSAKLGSHRVGSVLYGLRPLFSRTSSCFFLSDTVSSINSNIFCTSVQLIYCSFIYCTTVRYILIYSSIISSFRQGALKMLNMQYTSTYIPFNTPHKHCL
jgi:hypothetical protein